MSKQTLCAISKGALEDFLSTVFKRHSSHHNPVAELFIEAYTEQGGTLSPQELALMAGNTCPDTGRGYGLPTRVQLGPDMPFKKLEIIVRQTTGWQPAGDLNPECN